MRLNEVFKPLFESAYSALEEHEIKSYHEDINAYAKRGKFIYRGMSDTGDLIIGNGSQMERRAANTLNYINTLVDYVLPSWSNFPKRSKSFICSTDALDAANFGESVYVVIPLENQTMAFCPQEDFWECFENWDVDLLNDMFSTLFIDAAKLGLIDKKYQTRTNHITPEELKTIIKQISDLDEDEYLGFKKANSEYFNDFIDEIIKNGGFSNFLENVLNPSEFKILKYPVSFPPMKVEVWLSGKVLFVRKDVFKGFSK